MTQNILMFYVSDILQNIRYQASQDVAEEEVREDVWAKGIKIKKYKEQIYLNILEVSNIIRLQGVQAGQDSI